jgi:hypothetical protein
LWIDVSRREPFGRYSGWTENVPVVPTVPQEFSTDFHRMRSRWQRITGRPLGPRGGRETGSWCYWGVVLWVSGLHACRTAPYSGILSCRACCDGIPVNSPGTGRPEPRTHPGAVREAHLSTQQPPSGPTARISASDAHAFRAFDRGGSPPQGSLGADGLRMGRAAGVCETHRTPGVPGGDEAWSPGLPIRHGALPAASPGQVSGRESAPEGGLHRGTSGGRGNSPQPGTTATPAPDGGTTLSDPTRHGSRGASAASQRRDDVRSAGDPARRVPGKRPGPTGAQAHGFPVTPGPDAQESGAGESGAQQPTRSRSPLARLLLVLVGWYRRYVSPVLPPSCRFYPTCSTYAVQAIEMHGAMRGSVLAGRRILRCHPWNPGGFDPVPGSRERAHRGSGTAEAGSGTAQNRLGPPDDLPDRDN